MCLKVLRKFICFGLDLVLFSYCCTNIRLFCFLKCNKLVVIGMNRDIIAKLTIIREKKELVWLKFNCSVSINNV